jgi:hypothetical protein
MTTTITGRTWYCVKCGLKHAFVDLNCRKCRSPFLGEGFSAAEVQCTNCKKKFVRGRSYCPICKSSLYISNPQEQRYYPKIENLITVNCFVVEATETLVTQSTNLNSETLYVVGTGDIMPIVSETNTQYEVTLPGKQTGYVLKSTGFPTEFGISEISDPLGYVRSFREAGQSSVYVQLPNRIMKEVYKIKEEDRIPVVEESENAYKVQLKSGLRGWVFKAFVIRTKSPLSLPKEDSEGNLIGAVLGALLLGGLVIAGESHDVNKMSRAVTKGIRESK